MARMAAIPAAWAPSRRVRASAPPVAEAAAAAVWTVAELGARCADGEDAGRAEGSGGGTASAAPLAIQRGRSSGGAQRVGRGIDGSALEVDDSEAPVGVVARELLAAVVAADQVLEGQRADSIGAMRHPVAFRSSSSKRRFCGSTMATTRTFPCSFSSSGRVRVRMARSWPSLRWACGSGRRKAARLATATPIWRLRAFTSTGSET